MAGTISLVPASRPAIVTLVRRALLLQCAWCGNRPGFRLGTWRGWFRRHDRCQSCGVSVQRGQQGFELGAATVNVMLTLTTLIAAGAISVVSTYPHVAVAPLVVILGAVAIVLPVLLYPLSFTLWFAFEVLVDPPVGDSPSLKLPGA